jgi:hypothetical protein
VGAAATTLSVLVGQPAGGTAGRVDHVYHLQVEDERWASSPIVTDSAIVSREADLLRYPNNTGARNWLADKGTVWCEVIPQWTTGADVAGKTFVIYAVRYDSSNYFRFLYDGTSGELRFEVRAAGALATASKAWSAARGVPAVLAARWTSDSQELGLTARTVSVFVDGVKGTDALAVAAPTESAAANLDFGSDAGANNFNGVIRRTLVAQDVFSDIEIARGLPLR